MLDETKSPGVEHAAGVDRGRRNAMRKIAISVGVLAGISVLPERWTRPIVGQIVLPAHAATSGATLHDPCEVEWGQGDSSTAMVVVKVNGFVAPPTANLPVMITATAGGGANTQVTAQATTSVAGTFEVFMTIGGGPGIMVVNVSTSVTGADGLARCSAYPPSGQQPTTAPPTTAMSPTTTPGSQSTPSSTTATPTTTVSPTTTPGSQSAPSFTTVAPATTVSSATTPTPGSQSAPF